MWVQSLFSSFIDSSLRYYICTRFLYLQTGCLQGIYYFQSNLFCWVLEILGRASTNHYVITYCWSSGMQICRIHLCSYIFLSLWNCYLKNISNTLPTKSLKFLLWPCIHDGMFMLSHQSTFHLFIEHGNYFAHKFIPKAPPGISRHNLLVVLMVQLLIYQLSLDRTIALCGKHITGRHMFCMLCLRHQ